MNPKQIGEITQSIVVAELLKLGFSVSTPYGDNQRYDLIVDKEGRLFRVQVKTGKLKNNYIEIPVCSSYAHRNNGSKSYKDQIELFIAHCHENSETYLLLIYEVGTSNVKLRLSPAKNNQIKGVRLASCYLLKNRINCF